MNFKFLVLSLLVSVGSVSAQLVITPGSQFSINGNMLLTLNNADLVNDGNFDAGNGITSFTGDISSHILGIQPLQFNQLEVNKTGSGVLLLRKDIAVTQRILFTSGFLMLAGKNIDLGTTGFLENERENSAIADVIGGEVLFKVNLDAPAAVNPANLGLFITSSQNLGNAIIKRGHNLELDNTGASVSILRYYEVVPAINTDPNATLRFTYFDAELNGFNENSLNFFQHQNNNWVDIGFTSRNSTTNYVEKTGLSSVGKFTLATSTVVLPLHFISFDVKCEGNAVLLQWKTAQEQNTHDFIIERSTDARNWLTIGNTPASGNSSTQRSYSFTDNAPQQNALYRIAAYDLDGQVQYSQLLDAGCSQKEQISIWPNPVRDDMFINIVTAKSSKAAIKLFDNKGALVKTQFVNILSGSSRLNIDMSLLPTGVYTLSVDFGHRQLNKTFKISKL